MEKTKVAGAFVSTADLRPGDFFKFTSSGTEYQVAAKCEANRVMAHPLYVCRRVELDGKTGNLFVIEDDRPVILTRIAEY